MGDTVYLQRVREDIEGARTSGVRSTPTFFIDGEIHDVSFGLQGLLDTVDTALKKKR
jgi:protein-disulfide isomerase